MRTFRTIVVLIGLLTMAVPFFSVPAGAAQATTTVTLENVQVGVAETAVVEARIACGVAEGCSGVTLTLAFDRDLIRVHNVSWGPYLGTQVFEAQRQIDNAAGTVTLSGAALQPPASGAENILFSLEIGGLVPGTAELRIESLQIVAPTGGQLPASGGTGTATVFETGKIPFFSPPVNEWEVAFVSERDGNPEIYAVNASGAGLRRLTENTVLDGAPAWSPDGSRLAFHSMRDGGLDIYVMDPDGGNVRRLTDHPASDYAPAWSPDGSQIAFISDRDGNAALYVMNADGTNPQRVGSSAGQQNEPAWAPDGQRIAYSANPGGAFEIFLVNTDGSGVQQITNLFGANGRHPAWSPSSAELSFSTERDGMADVYTMTPQGQNLVKRTPQADRLTSTDWSPDGNYLALMSVSQTSIMDLYVLDLRANYWYRLTEDPELDYDPDWRNVGPVGTCTISTTRNNVSVRVGPGTNRSIFDVLPPNRDILVTGQATDSQGALWYQLDKDALTKSTAVSSLWVAAADVDAVGACGAVALAEAPPIVFAAQPTPPGSGQWGGCGSCTTCGHPANECVLSPDGQCLWDPATCVQPPPPEITTQPDCYYVTRIVDAPPGYPASITLRPAPNCGQGGYTPGTLISAVASGGWYSWKGSTCPGVENSTSSFVQFTITFSCTLYARFD